MLNVLIDIDNAQKLIKKSKGRKRKAPKKRKASAVVQVPNPLDQKYDELNCHLDVVPRSSKQYKEIEAYLRATEVMALQKGSQWAKALQIVHAFEVDREGDKRFKPWEKLANRKLLWHGTNVAVIAAILNSGLRIMPHSGGRVGKGLYFASELAKSQSYIRFDPHTKLGCVFLVETALGKEHHIDKDDSSLRKAPPKHNSIVALGRQCNVQHPKSKPRTMKLRDGTSVLVPVEKATATPHKSSSFWNSEYLVYGKRSARKRFEKDCLCFWTFLDESQARIRFLLVIKYQG